jgi:inositol transport system substrate-binding protein
MKLFPNGARVMYLQGQSGASPAIDRSNGLHNVLDKARNEYKFVFEHTAGSIAPKACRLRNQR